MIKDFICSQLLKDKFEEQRKINVPQSLFFFLEGEGYILIYHFSDGRKRVIYRFYLYLRGYLLHYHIEVVFNFFKIFFFLEVAEE